MSVTVKPEDQKISDIGETAEITDKRGRKLAFRAINALEQSRLCLIVGPEASLNPRYMTGYVMPVCSVRAIDGEPVQMPKTQLQLDYLIQTLDDDGISAVVAYVYAQEKSEAEEAQVKNS